MFRHIHLNKIVFQSVILLAMLCMSACVPSAAQMNNKGNKIYDKQEYQNALDNYLQAQQNAKAKAVPDYNLGNTYYRLGQLDSAESSLNSSLAEAGDSLAQNAYYNLGNTLYSEGQYEAAIEAYKEALRIDADDQEAKYNLELAEEQLEKQKQQEQSSQDSGEESDNSQQDDRQNQQEQNQQPEQNQTPTPQANRQEQQSDEQQEQQQNEQSTMDEENEDQPQEEAGELSQEQARQLLDAASDETQSLQEYLQQIYVAPGENPEKDW